MAAYYNEFEPYAAEWLRNLIKEGLIADGEVDSRSIIDVRPDDLRGFTQCHFFAGIAGWSLAARLAGWPDERPLWTGSCPCQPFSVAGRQEGTKDERHLWPEFFRLIDACRPPVVMGEQVAAAVGKHWLDGVFDDLEGIGYACGAAVIPACAVDAPHRRDRLWFVADAKSGSGWARLCQDQPKCNGNQFGHSGSVGDVADADSTRSQPGKWDDQTARHWNPFATANQFGSWRDAEWIAGHDGKARRVKSGIRLLANGVPARVGKLRAAGNAIVPKVAAEVIAAFMEAQ